MKKKSLSTAFLTAIIISVLILVVTVHFGAAQSGITRVQGPAKGTSTNSTISVTMASTPTSGNLLIACIGTLATPSTDYVSSISETGVTWTKQISNYEGEWDSEIWAGVVGSGASTSITINLLANGELLWGGVADVCEYSGLATSSFLDQTATSTAISASTSTGTTATTLQSNELWIGSIICCYAQSSPTNGFTLLDGYNSYISEAYLENIVSATGVAQTGTTLAAPSNGGESAGCIATFIEAPIIATPTLTPTPSATTVPPNQTQAPSSLPQEAIYGISVTVAIVVIVAVVLILRKRDKGKS